MSCAMLEGNILIANIVAFLVVNHVSINRGAGFPQGKKRM
jgi:hypothetical protein